jgi:hypothetical protein
MKTKEILNLAPTPLDENCSEVGDINYREEALKEIHAFINQLRRQFGKEPEGCRYKITSNRHDFGTYYDLDIVFYADDENETETEKYAYNVENNLPYNWDEEAIKELNLQTI